MLAGLAHTESISKCFKRNQTSLSQPTVYGMDFSSFHLAPVPLLSCALYSYKLIIFVAFVIIAVLSRPDICHTVLLLATSSAVYFRNIFWNTFATNTPSLLSKSYRWSETNIQQYLHSLSNRLTFLHQHFSRTTHYLCGLSRLLWWKKKIILNTSVRRIKSYWVFRLFSFSIFWSD